MIEAHTGTLAQGMSYPSRTRDTAGFFAPTSTREVEAMDWAQEVQEWSHDRVIRNAGTHHEDTFGPADYDAAEALVLAAGTRKSAGLVSYSTTAKAGSRALSLRVARAKALARVEGNRAVVVPDPERQRIAALRCAVGVAARLHAVSEKGKRTDQVRMLTLTYHHGGDWRPEHVKRLLDRYRQWLKQTGIPFRYVWVAELQKRGVIHYHVAMFLPYGVRVPMADESGWWPYGSTRIELARNAVPYLMKYLSKGKSSEGAWTMPLGARMYGVGGLEHSLRRCRRWTRLPAFVQCNSDVNDDWRRAGELGIEGGGWYARPSDGIGPPKHWPSEWKPCTVGGIRALERVHTHTRELETRPAMFCWWNP